MTKPPDCTCGFPEVMARNPSGHLLSCPSYGRWVADAEARGRSLGLFASPPAADPPEADPVVVCNCYGMNPHAAPGRRYSAQTGHADDCPVHAAIVADYAPAPDRPRETATGPEEDRGTPVWIWSSASYVMFQPFDDATRRVEVSVPIGWDLRPDRDRGVVLRNVFGNVFPATKALEMAVIGADGFRVRSEQRIGAAHVGV